MYFRSKIDNINTTIKFSILELVVNFSLNNFDFFYYIWPKSVFLVENRDIKHHHWILLIWIRVGAKLQLKWTILIFGPNLPKKGISSWIQLKAGKVNTIIEFCMFEVVKVTNFSWKWQFWFVGSSLPKKWYFWSKTVKLQFCVRPRSLHTLKFSARRPTDITLLLVTETKKGSNFLWCIIECWMY